MPGNFQRLKKVSATFKANHTPEQSVITLAGTGPNGACQIPILSALSYDYLCRLHSLNIMSASVFSFFIFLAHHTKQLKFDGFLKHEHHTRETHGFPIFKLLTNIVTGKPMKNLYDNVLISQAVDNLFHPQFAELTLSDINIPVNVYAYCLNDNKSIKINRFTYPHISVRALCHASVSIPWIHGTFHFGKHAFIDPMFSKDFPNLRRSLLSMDKNQLYANYKKSSVSNRITFIKNEDLKHPQLHIISDFIKFYVGIHNRRISKSHKMIAEDGF